jgi:hypothetical protein
MNLDAPRPFVVLDSEVVIEKKTRSTFRIRYPLCGVVPPRRFLGLLLGRVMAILNKRFWHKVCKKTGPALRALHQTQIRMYGKLSTP